MITWRNKQDCCGCAACSNICPKSCIHMSSDEEGFLYPEVDSNSCIDCGLCEKVCPMINYNEPKDEINIGYAGRIKQLGELNSVASGGIYTALAKSITEQKGYAVGVEYKDGLIRHCIESSPEHISLQSGSKYVQSNTGDIYKRTKELLLMGREVIFSGSPCQIVALQKYLGNKYENLTTIEILCAGVMSPLVFESYKKLINERSKNGISYLNFKRKTYGYHSSTMYVRFGNGKTLNRSRLTDELMHVFTAHIADRPSCSICPFKGKNRVSDITIFDCWHYSELSGERDDNKGYTNIVVHTKHGNELLTKETSIILKKINVDQAIQLDGNMVFGVQKPHQKREMFFSDLNENGLHEAITNNCPITYKDRIAEASKGLLYRIGILDAVKRFKRR